MMAWPTVKNLQKPEKEFGVQSVEDMQKIVDANEKLVKDLKDAKD